MSSENRPTTNGQQPSDLALLAALISADHSDEHADENLVELLQQLERADIVARGMEGRLDSLIEQLDSLVEGLEAGQQDKGQPEDQNTSMQSEIKDPDAPQPSG